MEKSFLKQMGIRLCARRKQLGLTQEQLAERMDVSIQMISNMENGNKAIRPDNLLKVCQILDVSSDYILTGMQSPKEVAQIVNKMNSLSERDRRLIEMEVDYLIDNK